MTNFKDLGLTPTLLNILTREGYETPTPIQAQAIPFLLKGHDLQGIAQTGTGKTAAFALPILHHLLADRKIPQPRTVRALILSPTRELASQIAESFKTYSAGMGLAIATIYGGVKYAQQYKALNGGLDILVATPGRLLDHIEQKTVDLRQVEYFVLDEADQMLDLGFVKPIRQIASRLAAKRQNLFFSATMPKEIGTLASELLTDPKRVEVTPQATTAERVEQKVIYVEAIRKRALLSELYAEDELTRTLVFTRTKRSADRVAAYLQAGGIEAAAIHGDKNQGQRERALMAFRDGRVRALVATDIAARGIDVDNVSHVINYELPHVTEAYVHRIGRTARAGNTGIAITLCSDDERKLLKDIQRVTRQTIPAFDRRKDKALALLDEAILASGQTEKPKTPERLKTKSDRGRETDRPNRRARTRPGQHEARSNARPEFRQDVRSDKYAEPRDEARSKPAKSLDDQGLPPIDFGDYSRSSAAKRGHEGAQRKPSDSKGGQRKPWAKPGRASEKPFDKKSSYDRTSERAPARANERSYDPLLAEKSPNRGAAPKPGGEYRKPFKKSGYGKSAPSIGQRSEGSEKSGASFKRKPKRA